MNRRKRLFHIAEGAFGLDAAQFGQGAMQGALGCGASAVDRGLDLVEFLFCYRAKRPAECRALRFFRSRAKRPAECRALRFLTGSIRRLGFDSGAAAEAPGGMDDFAGESLFEESFRGKLGGVGGAETLEKFLFFGANEGCRGYKWGGGGHCGSRIAEDNGAASASCWIGWGEGA
jgi:hypothetical protein